MALKGTLRDFGIGEIFQLIGSQQKTGVLHLVDRDDEVHVAFKGGSVVQATSATRKKKDLLGNLLVRAAVITDKQLEYALEEQRRSLKRIGDILVALGAINRDTIRQMAHLQTTETVYKLFSWKSGSYDFEATGVAYDPESLEPVRSETVLLEGFRRVDEWPLIRAKITSGAMTFLKLSEPPVAPGEEAVPNGVSSRGSSAAADPHRRVAGVGPNERRVFALVEPGRDARSIADRSRLGEFEACKALLNLINLGFLKGQAAEDEGPATSSRRRLAAAGVAIAGRAAVSMLLLGAVVFALSRVNVEWPAFSGSGARTYADPALQRFLSRSQVSRIETALSAFALEEGEAPESLGALVEAGHLTELDLRYPFDEPYYYRKAGPQAHVLLPPLK